MIEIDNLTLEQEDKLRDIHAKNYMGTDDDMPENYEYWLGSLNQDEIGLLLSNNR